MRPGATRLSSMNYDEVSLVAVPACHDGEEGAEIMLMKSHPSAGDSHTDSTSKCDHSKLKKGSKCPECEAVVKSVSFTVASTGDIQSERFARLRQEVTGTAR